jgi:hypothetical protein
MNELYLEAEILANTKQETGHDLTHQLNNASIPKYRVLKSKSIKAQLELLIRNNNKTQYLVSDYLTNLNPHLNFKPSLIQSQQTTIAKSRGILLGTDAYTKAEVRLLTEYLSSDIVSVGSSGSGKSLYNHLFLYNAFKITNRLCVPYFDFKGEAKRSLSYMADGKTKTFLADKIIEITHYERGMILPLMEKDKIIIINLAFIKDDEVKFRETILSVLQDINIKLKEFEREFTKKDVHQNVVKIAELPYSILVLYEEAYKIYANLRSKVYESLKFMNKEFERKRKALEDRASVFKRSKDIDSYEVTIAELENIPDLLWLQNKIMLIGQDNANTMRYLGLGSLYSVQRFAELDTGLLSQSSTWFVHNVNIAQDEKALKETSKIDKKVLRDYLTKISEEKRIKYLLVSSPSVKTIIKKPKPQLFHMAVSQQLDERTDLFGIDELK